MAHPTLRRTAIYTSFLAAVADHVRAEIGRLPASQQAPTLRFTARYLADERRTQTRQTGDGVCLLFAGADMSGGECGATATDLANWGLLADLGPVSGVVPNGVAAVTVRFPAYEGQPAQTSTVKVINNVFVTRLTRPNGGRRIPGTISWRSASGTIIKTVPGRVEGVGSSGWCGGIGCQ